MWMSQFNHSVSRKLKRFPQFPSVSLLSRVLASHKLTAECLIRKVQAATATEQAGMTSFSVWSYPTLDAKYCLIFSRVGALSLLLFQPAIVALQLSACLLLHKHPSHSGYSLEGILFPQAPALLLPLKVSLAKSLSIILFINKA